MNGVYYVSITVKVNSLNPVGLAVSRNDELFLHLRERYNNPMIAGNTLTNSGVLNCLEGQHISVTAHENSTVHGDPNLAYTTLTVMYMSREGNFIFILKIGHIYQCVFNYFLKPKEQGITIFNTLKYIKAQSVLFNVQGHAVGSLPKQ